MAPSRLSLLPLLLFLACPLRAVSSLTPPDLSETSILSSDPLLREQEARGGVVAARDDVSEDDDVSDAERANDVIIREAATVQSALGHVLRFFARLAPKYGGGDMGTETETESGMEGDTEMGTGLDEELEEEEAEEGGETEEAMEPGEEGEEGEEEGDDAEDDRECAENIPLRDLMRIKIHNALRAMGDAHSTTRKLLMATGVDLLLADQPSAILLSPVDSAYERLIQKPEFLALLRSANATFRVLKNILKNQILGSNGNFEDFYEEDTHASTLLGVPFTEGDQNLQDALMGEMRKVTVTATCGHGTESAEIEIYETREVLVPDALAALLLLLKEGPAEGALQADDISVGIISEAWPGLRFAERMQEGEEEKKRILAARSSSRKELARY